MTFLDQLNEWIEDNPYHDRSVSVVNYQVPLSQTVIWELLASYYMDQGIKAWDIIPFYITSNPTIADVYSELIIRFCLDYVDHLDFSQPLTVLELATGPGQFSFYMLKTLKEKLSYWPQLKGLTLRYVMTDFSQSTLDHWQQNSYFTAWFNDPTVQLDFGVFAPNTDQQLTLIRSGETLKPGFTNNPIVALANYFFDSLPLDQFVVMGKTESEQVLHETLYTYYRQGHDRDANPHDMNNLKYMEQHCPTQLPYYHVEAIDAVLDHYVTHHPNTRFFFPSGSLDVFENIKALSNNNFVMLASDKGFCQDVDFQGFGGRSFTMHDNAFSFMVNFHALKTYMTLQGGHTFLTEPEALNLKTGFFALTRHPVELTQTRYTFDQTLNKQNPINSMINVSYWIDATPDVKENPEQAFDMITSLFHLSQFDPFLLNKAAPLLLELDDLSRPRKTELYVVLRGVFENLFHFKYDLQAHGWLTILFEHFEFYDEVIAVVERAQILFGPDGSLLTAKARAMRKKDQLRPALMTYKLALQHLNNEDSINDVHQQIEALEAELETASQEA